MNDIFMKGHAEKVPDDIQVLWQSVVYTQPQGLSEEKEQN